MQLNSRINFGANTSYNSANEEFIFEGNVLQSINLNGGGHTVNKITVTNTSADVQIGDSTAGQQNHTINLLESVIAGTNIKFRVDDQFTIGNFHLDGGVGTITVDTDTGAGTWKLNALSHAVDNVACNRSDASVGPTISGAPGTTLNACTNWLVGVNKYWVGGDALCSGSWDDVNCWANVSNGVGGFCRFGARRRRYSAI